MLKVLIVLQISKPLYVSFIYLYLIHAWLGESLDSSCSYYCPARRPYSSGQRVQSADVCCSSESTVGDRKPPAGARR